jgi:hypothetical protein
MNAHSRECSSRICCSGYQKRGHIHFVPAMSRDRPRLGSHGFRSGRVPHFRPDPPPVSDDADEPQTQGLRLCNIARTPKISADFTTASLGAQGPLGPPGAPAASRRAARGSGRHQPLSRRRDWGLKGSPRGDSAAGLPQGSSRSNSYAVSRSIATSALRLSTSR